MRFDRVTYQVNYGCNQRCRHCFQEASPELIVKDKSNKVSCLAIVEGIIRLGFKEVKITGGEPILARELKQILAALYEDVRTSIISGGSAGSPRQWEDVARLCNMVWFSVYHLDAEVHNNMTQSPEAAQKLWRNLELVSQYSDVGVHLLLSRPLVEKGLGLKETLLSLCRRGISAVKILWPSPDGTALQYWALYDLPVGRWREVYEILLEVQGLYPQVNLALAYHAFDSETAAQAAINTDERLACSYGAPKLWGVDPHGILYPCCLLIGFPRYGLGRIWELNEGAVQGLTRALAVRDAQAVPGYGPDSCSGDCPGLADATGRDRRRSFGLVPVCPLVQAKAHPSTAGLFRGLE